MTLTPRAASPIRRLYLAAPLFTDAERAWNAAIAVTLRRALPGVEVLVPQEFCAPLDQTRAPDYAAIFAACVRHLDIADAVVVVLDGADPDSGTAWELGYAYALAKSRPIRRIGLRTDWRPAEDGTANCMLSRSCDVVVRTVEDAIAAL